MAGKVFFSVSMSLDGFIAPGSLGELMGQQWMELQQWIFPQRFFRENLKLGEGGEEGRDNDIARETFERTGASVMGKRMFDLGEQAWPEEAPFHTPVFVVTHEKRDPWERPGGTTFHFVNDGIETALDQAREAAGDRDVRIAGGGATILEYVNAGLIDEFSIALSPVLFGSGIRLFEGVDAGRVALEPVRAEPTQRGEILDALSVRKGERSGRDLGRALLREGPHGVVVELPRHGQASPANHQEPRLPRRRCRDGVQAHRISTDPVDVRLTKSSAGAQRLALGGGYFEIISWVGDRPGWRA